MIGTTMLKVSRRSKDEVYQSLKNNGLKAVRSMAKART